LRHGDPSLRSSRPSRPVPTHPYWRCWPTESSPLLRPTFSAGVVLCEPGDEPRRGLARADALLCTAQNGEAAPGAPTRPTRRPPLRIPTPGASSPWRKPMSVPPTYLYNTLRSDTPVVVPLPYFASSVSERPLSGPGSRGPFSELRVIAELVTTVSWCLRFCVYCPVVFGVPPLMVRVFVSYPVFPSVLSFLSITRTCE
jgi:hypothetical protein